MQKPVFMRLSLVVLAVLTLSSTAFAETTRSTGVLSRGREAFGKKVDDAKTKGIRKGIDIKGAVLDGKIGTQTGEGNARRGCAGKGAILSGSVEANLGANKDTSKTPKTTKTGGKCGLVGQVGGVGAAASLVNVSGDCATAVGTFGGKATGLGANAGISACEIEAKADLIFGEVSYDTPTVTVCGVTAGLSASVGGGIGLGVGVGRQGTVGVKGRLGPVKGGLGFNGGFSGAGAKNCANKALGFVKGLFNPPRSVVTRAASRTISSVRSASKWFSP